MNMRRSKSKLFNYLLPVAAVTCAAVSWSSPSDAFVQQLVVDQMATVTFKPIPLGTSVPGSETSYTVYQGRIFGALDPQSSHNTIITDIGHAPTTAGKVGYIANFQIVTPTNAADRSGLLIYEVSNRGGNAISTNSLVQGATYVQSGWQGDLLAECSLSTPAPYPCVNLNSGPYGTLNTITGAFAPPKVPVIADTTQLTSYVIQVPVATTDGKRYRTGKTPSPVRCTRTSRQVRPAALRNSSSAIPPTLVARLRPTNRQAWTPVKPPSGAKHLRVLAVWTPTRRLFQAAPGLGHTAQAGHLRRQTRRGFA
jgi:hypothetical protein